MKRKVDCLTELKDQPFDAVFNCTGLSAGWLCNDKKVIPVRGQVFKASSNVHICLRPNDPNRIRSVMPSYILFIAGESSMDQNVLLR